MATHGFRRPAVLLLVASLAALVFLFSSGSDSTRAVPIATTYPTSVTPLTAGAPGDVTTSYDIPEPNSFPWGGTVSFIPPAWGSATDTLDVSTVPVDVAEGVVVGQLNAFVQLGIQAFSLNACIFPTLIPFALVDATVDHSVTIDGSPSETAWKGDRDEDSNGDGVLGDTDGLPDAVTLWPLYIEAELDDLVDSGPHPHPIARYHSQIVVTPGLGAVSTTLAFLVFAPGALPDFPASMGQPIMTILEDPNAPEGLSAISLTCTGSPFNFFVSPPVANPPFTVTTILGDSGGEALLFNAPGDAPGAFSLLHRDSTTGALFVGPGPAFLSAEGCAADGDPGDDDGDGIIDEGCSNVIRRNPSAGSYEWPISAVAGRDTDNDGIENQLDKCPLTVDANTLPIGAPFPVGTGFNPRWPGPVCLLPTQSQDLDFDSLTATCDPSPFVPSPSGPFGVDEDGDVFSNGQDTCPLVADFSQAFSEAGKSIDVGPNDDDIGDVCDPNPTVSDGHSHRVWALGVVCIGGTDLDGDGWCDDIDPDDSVATGAGVGVEDIDFVRTCADGIDNDGDGDTDGDDTACQLANHDLRIFPPQVNGSPEPLSGQTTSYKVKVKNGTGDPEVARVGFLIDTTSQGLTDSCTAVITSMQGPGIVAGTERFGPINYDSGGYPTAQTAPIPVGPFFLFPISAATDMETEQFATADVAVLGNASTSVKIFVLWSCAADTGGPDFTVNIDVCHPADLDRGLFPPLFPAGTDCGLVGTGPDGAPDGGQDRVNTGNDDPIDKTIDVK